MTVAVRAATPEVRSPEVRSPAAVRPGRRVDWALVAAIVLLAGLARLPNLDLYTISFPEGIRAAQLQLMAAGYRPCVEIFCNQGPLLFYALYPPFLLFGQTLEAVRSGVVIFSLVGIGATYWAGHLLGGRTAAIVAAGLVALSPTYLKFSRLALAEVPAVAPAVLAVGAALLFQRTGRDRWLVAAALLVALSLLLKPVTLAVCAPVGLSVLLWPRRRTRNVALLVAATGLAIVLPTLAIGFSEILEQVVAFRLRSRGAEGRGLLWNAGRIVEELAADRAGLFMFASAGAALALVRLRSAALPIVAWLPASLLLLLLHTPLHGKHIVTLIPPAALLAGLGASLAWPALARAATALRSSGTLRQSAGPVQHQRADDGSAVNSPVILSWRRIHGVSAAGQSVDPAPAQDDRTGPDEKIRSRAPHHLHGLALLPVLLVALGGVAYVLTLPSFVARDHKLMYDPDPLEGDPPSYWYPEVIDTLRRVTDPTDVIVTDHPYLTFMAGRLVPPPLVESSVTRVLAASLTADDAIAASDRYGADAVLLWADKLTTMKEYKTWVDRTYVPVRAWAADGEATPTLYVRPELVDRARTELARLAPVVSGAQFEGGIRLVASGLDRPRVAAGDSAAITLSFEALTKPSASFLVVVQLRDSSGEVWRSDEIPLAGLAAGAASWTPGRTMSLAVLVRPQRSVKPGDYALSLRLYDPRGRRFVDVDDPAHAGDRLDPKGLTLGTVTVVASDAR